MLPRLQLENAQARPFTRQRERRHDRHTEALTHHFEQSHHVAHLEGDAGLAGCDGKERSDRRFTAGRRHDEGQRQEFADRGCRAERAVVTARGNHEKVVLRDHLAGQVGCEFGSEADIDGITRGPVADLGVRAFGQSDGDVGIAGPEQPQAVGKHLRRCAGDAAEPQAAAIEPCPVGAMLMDTLDGA